MHKIQSATCFFFFFSIGSETKASWLHVQSAAARKKRVTSDNSSARDATTATQMSREDLPSPLHSRGKHTHCQLACIILRYLYMSPITSFSSLLQAHLGYEKAQTLQKHNTLRNIARIIESSDSEQHPQKNTRIREPGGTGRTRKPGHQDTRTPRQRPKEGRREDSEQQSYLLHIPNFCSFVQYIIFHWISFS